MAYSRPEEYKTEIPVSTYRLQFNRHFTFQDAKKIVPYLKALGVSHIYASPLLQSKTGSLHGYDIINHSSFNPEIGSENDFDELVNIIKKNKMGIILDIVPNHMAADKENKWWMDVLENGQASEYANFFDIDWFPVKKELSEKVLVAVLSDHYGNILINNGFKFCFEPRIR